MVFLPLLLFALEVDFTNGRVKNFRTELVKSPVYTVGTGLTGKSGGRIIGTGLDLDAALTEKAEVYTGGEKLKYAKLYFDSDGKNFAENRMVRGKVSGDKVTFSFAGVPRRQGKIGALRIDLVPVDGGITVKKIAITENQPGVPGTVDFTTGIRGKWGVVNAAKAVCRKQSGLEVTANAVAVRLISPVLDIDAGKCDIVEMDLRGTGDSFKLYFSADGKSYSESDMVRGRRDGDIVIFELSANRRWRGNIRTVRIDVSGKKGGVNIFRKIFFRKGDGSSSLKSPFRYPVTLSPGRSVTGKCESRFPARIFFRVQSSGKADLRATLKDVYGETLRVVELPLVPGGAAGEFPEEVRCAAVELALSNPGKTAVEVKVELFQFPPVAVKEPGKSVHRVSLTGFPEKTDEKSVVTPYLVLPDDVKEDSEVVLRIKGDNGLNIIGADQKAGKERKITLPQLYFRYLSSGKYQVSVEIDGVPCDMERTTFTHERKTPVSPASTVIDRSTSRPFYVINGSEKADVMEYLASDPPLSRWAFRQIFNAVDRGINGIRLRLIFRFDGNSEVDFREIDSEIQTVLMRAPQVNIMLHTSVTDPGPRWRAAHPEEGIRDENGEYRILNYSPKPEATSSMASERWVADSQKMLTLLVKHLQSIPAGERIIGVLPCSGMTWEWLHWGSGRGVMVDYSEHYKKYFISYLKKIYNNDIRQLNSAWKKSYANFDSVEMPTPQRRRMADMTEFRTPEKFRAEKDYTDSLSYLISGIIGKLCRTVKESSGGKLLSGTYYGYTIYLTGALRAHNTGHFALDELLKSPYLDILMAPTRYAGRHVGEASGFMFPEASVNLHGKLIISECDDRPINASNGTGRAESVAGSRAVFERACGMQYSAKGAVRFFDFSKGWVMDEPRLLDVVKKLAAFDREIREANPAEMRSCDAAAVFTGERSAAVLNPDSRLFFQLLEHGYREFAASGMSFDMFNIEDLDKVFSDRKLLFFINCFLLNDAEKAAVEKAVRRRDVYITSGIGVFDKDGKFDLSFMKELFGCDFQHSIPRKERSCKATNEMKKLFGIPAGTVFSSNEAVGDVLYPVGKNFIPLAVNQQGDTVIAAFERDGKYLIYSAYPILPKQLLKALADNSALPRIEAGNAAVWFGGAFGMVHTARAVTASVKLPAGFKGIVEYPDMKFIPVKNGKVIKKLEPESTWLFYLKK